jgi:hypothetical protein
MENFNTLIDNSTKIIQEHWTEDWFIQRYMVFVVLYTFNLLFPFTGDDLANLEAAQQYSFIEGAKWWYNGLNPRVQNLLTLITSTRYMMLHDFFAAIVGVGFFELISRITKVNFIRTVLFLSITILPAMWVDFYFYKAAFYNHYLGAFIGLLTYYAYSNRLHPVIIILLTLILSNTGILTAIPFLILIAYKFRRWEVIVGIFGFIAFYSFPATHIRAYGFNNGAGRFPTYHPFIILRKIVISWEYFIVPFIITVLSYKRIKELITNDLGWILASVSCLLLTAIAPISYIGMDRWTALIILLYSIPLLKYVNWNLGYKSFATITIIGLFLNLCCLDLKKDLIMDKYFINFNFKINDKKSFDDYIEIGTKIYNDKNEN